jgi:hypothetical protein
VEGFSEDEFKEWKDELQKGVKEGDWADLIHRTYVLQQIAGSFLFIIAHAMIVKLRVDEKKKLDSSLTVTDPFYGAWSSCNLAPEAVKCPFHNILLSTPHSSPPIGGLYLGSDLAIKKERWHALRSENITVIVRAMDGPWPPMPSEEEGFTGYLLAIEDWEDQVLSNEDLDAVCEYIHKMRKSGKNVLVHCQMVFPPFFPLAPRLT